MEPTSLSSPPTGNATPTRWHAPPDDAALTGLPRDLQPTDSVADTTGKSLENLAFDAQCRLYAASLMERRILRRQQDSGLSTFADLGIFPLSLEADVDGTWYVTGMRSCFTQDVTHYEQSQQVWRITPDGRAEHFVDLPQARALNGSRLACSSLPTRLL